MGESDYAVGQKVFFWTGRGSQGLGTIRAIKGNRAFIDPAPDAIKGSDFRVLHPTNREVWGPRDHGVRLDQLNTAPRIWWKDL